MSKDPAFLFYSKDWIEGTAELFPEEKGVYIDLISHQHQKGELPKDKRRLARLVGLDLDSFSKIWENIKDKFIESDSGFINQRIAKETAKRSLSGVKKSCLAVYGNWIKGNSEISKTIVKSIKDTFSLDDFTGIEDEEKRKESIINHLEKRKDELLANAKRTHIANGNAIVNGNANKNVDDIEVENCFKKCLNYFPEHLHPKSDNQKQDWKDTIEKLNRIDKIPFDKIIEITKSARENDFWSKNFMSLKKLRSKNKEWIMYVVVFNEQFKSKSTNYGNYFNEGMEKIKNDPNHIANNLDI